MLRAIFPRARSAPRWGLRGGWATGSVQRSPFILDQIEPRLLLSGDPLASIAAGAILQTHLTDADEQVVVELIGLAGDGGIIVDLTVDGVTEVYGTADAGLFGIDIDGQGGNDRFEFIDIPVAVALDGGSGVDLLVGPQADSLWSITGAGAGTVGHVAFSDVENLAGAADNEDVFVFEAAGGISGVVDGGDGGFDSIVLDGGSFDTVIYTATGPNSGSIQRDADVLTYAGMEPVTNTGNANNMIFVVDAGANDDQINISDSAGSLRIASGNALFELTDIASAPSGTVEIRSGGGNDVFTFLGAPGAFDSKLKLTGDSGTDTVQTTQGAAMTLSNASLAIGSNNIVLTSIEQASLTGTGAANTFSVSNWTGSATLAGLGGNDTYAFGATFGNVTLASSDAGTDKLDFTLVDTVTHPITVSADKSTIQIASTSSTLHQPATASEQAEEIDITLLAGAKAKITETLDRLASLIDRAQTDANALSELTNALPFLGALTGGKVPSLAGLLELTQTFKDLKGAVDGAIGTVASATPRLSDVVLALNAMVKPSFFTGGSNHLLFRTDYRGAAVGSGLEGLIDLDMHGSAAAALKLETGAEAKGAGIDINATINASATLDGLLSVGVTTTSATPVVFLVPERTVTLDAQATASLGGAHLNLGILGLTLSAGSVQYGGYVDVTLKDLGDADARITADEIIGGTSDPLSSLIAVTTGVSTPFSASLTVAIDSGVKVGGVDLSSKSITASVTLPGGIFGSAAGASSPHFDFSTSGLSLNDFSNVSTNDLLGMLGQVLDTLRGLATSPVLDTAIPYTDKTLGDVVDIASGFKAEVLDPLFRSGDILDPDFNGDGATDFNDLYFSSIQSLAQALTAQLGLGSLLDVIYDAATQELSFSVNFDRSVSDAKVVETTAGDASTNEVQTLTISAPASNGILADTFRLGFANSSGQMQFTSAIALGAAASVVQTRLRDDLAGIGATDVAVAASGPNKYVITFQNGLGHKNVPLLVLDSTELALGVPLNFGTSLGDLASVKTTGTAIMAANLSAGLTFGINLNQSSKIEVLPPVFQADNMASVTVETTTAGTANLDEVQKIHVDNATSGTYTLWFDANHSQTAEPAEVTGAIAYNATAGAVQTALRALASLNPDEVTVTGGGLSGNDRTYTVTFVNGSGHTNVAQLAGDSTNLKGPGQNGVLSGPATIGDIELFYNPAIGVAAPVQGDSTHNEQQTVTLINATGGEFTLSYGGVPTTAILFGADASTVETRLNALSTIGGAGGSVTVGKVGNTYTVTFGGSLANTNVTMISGDASSLTNTGSAIHLTNVAVTGYAGNKSPEDLAADVQNAINTALVASGQTLGFFSASLSNGITFTAGAVPLTALTNDLAFTIVLTPAQIAAATTTGGDGTHDEVQTITVSNAVGGSFALGYGSKTTTDIGYSSSADAVKSALVAMDAGIGVGDIDVAKANGVFTITFKGALAKANVAQITADGAKLDSKTYSGNVRKWDADANGVQTALNHAIAATLAQAGSSITVAVGTSAGKLTLTPSGGGLQLDFRSPIAVDAGGGRVAISAVPVTAQVAQTGAPVLIDGRAQVMASYANRAYQEMGLMSAPTRYDGTITNPVDLHLIVNGTDVHVTLPVANTSTNTRIYDPDLPASLTTLVGDLQARVNTALSLAGFAGGDVTVFMVDESGNRIGFRGKDGTVTSLSINVPDSATNGAVTDLGFEAGNGEKHIAKADAFFLEDVSLEGSFALAAPSVTATATLGFIGLTATGSGTLANDKFLDLAVSVDLKNPSAIGPANRVTVGQIVDTLKAGDFFYLDANDDDIPDAGSGVVDVTVSGGVGFHFEVEPTTPIGSLPGLDAQLDITAQSPNWLVAAPSFADPLGFGTSEHALSGTPITLDTNLPTNGRLTDSVTFVIEQGSNNAIVFLAASATSGFSSLTDLQTALQGKVNDAMSAAGALGTVTVGISGSKISLTGTGATLSARGPIAFSGPDLDSVLDRFRDLSFDDIIAGLKYVVDFLRTLDGSSGAGSAVAGALDFKLPLIDKSVSDLVDIAGRFADKLNAIKNNPQGSIQELNKLINAQFGLPLSTPTLSFNVTEGTVFFDFGFDKSIHLSRPFNLDLAEAGLPSFFTNLVSLSASGSLDVGAGVDLDLQMGLDLTGEDKSFFLVTGASGTKLNAFLDASGNGLNFEAALGPFALSVIGGSARLNGTIDVTLVDDGDQRLDLVTFSGGVPTFHLPTLSDISVAFPTTAGKNSASVNLPLFIGTADNPIPLDFGGGSPGTQNALSVSVNLVKLLNSQSGAFSFTLPNFDFNDFQVPGLFALLSDPAVTVDGLDRLLGTLQDALNGQVMGVELPLIGDALANNPVANFIGDMRDDVLQPLANVIRENNLSLDGLVDVIQSTLFDVFSTKLGLLKDGSDPGTGISDADVEIKYLDDNGNVVPALTATALQLQMNLGKTWTFATDPIDLDLGIPALGISAQLQPQVTFGFDLKLGFGVDEKKGFYFVTDQDGAISGDGAPELSATVYADLGSTNSSTSFTDTNRADLDARLLFLALKVADGVDLNGDLTISRGTDTNADGIPDTGNEFTHILFTGAIDIDDPSGDGKLTIPEMVSGSFSDIVKPSLTGEAALHAQAKVDFSTLGNDVGKVLPAVTADLLIDFSLSATPTEGFEVAPPQVLIANVTLDLGSFLSDYAGPILNTIHDILEPVDWLIGRDGFLNKRIPLLSELAGHTITGKDLIVFFDPENGPTVVAVLDFVQELDYLAGLVSQATGEGNVGLNFGDLMLFDSPSIANPGGAFLDNLIDLGSSTSDIRDLSNFKNALSNLPGDLANKVTTTAPPGTATSSFTAGVTESASVSFPILKPENVFKLLLGQPDVSLVEVQMPKMQFNFLYRQSFPIIGPLVGTFAGGLGGGINFGFGYDTRGLEQFMVDKNPLSFVDGFYLTDLDSSGQDKDEAFLHAEIAVGAALNLGIASAGVEGGISADILFNLADLDADGKIRLTEMGANILANDGNPLAIFDIGGHLDLFMRAYVEFLFFKAEFEFLRVTLFEFEIPFDRPGILGDVSDGTLTLNIGTNAGKRLNGNLSDGDEHMVLAMDGSDVVIQSFSINGSPQDVPNIKGFTRFSGVTKIVADGGAGNDTIDLSAVSAAGIAVTLRGGTGNDTLKGGAGADSLYGDAGNDSLYGGGGIDNLYGSDGNDLLYGDAGNDKLMGEAGNDSLHGGTEDDTLLGGTGDDSYWGDGGTNTYALADFGSTETIDASSGGDTLDFSSKPQGLTFFLGDFGSGLQIQVGMTQTLTPPAGTDPVIANFADKVYVNNVDGVKKIIGSDFADTFYVHKTTTAGSGVTIDGGKGSDRILFVVGTPDIEATVDDTGNPWDSKNVIEVRGSPGADTITVKNSEIVLSGTQTVAYTSPAAGANVVEIKVFGNAGDDTLNIDSTSQTVPVRVDAGTGNDLVTVGNGTVNNIKGQSRTGLNAPFGLGPLVLVGGAGQDTVFIDDSQDNGANTGNLTAFTETRLGVTGTVEVGVVSGLGMTLKDGAATVTGRVEFEGFETSDVRLGKAADTFTVGGTSVLASLPQNRKVDADSEPIIDFVHTISGMTIIEGGGGSDNIGVIATNTLDRATLLTSSPGPLVTMATTTPGVTSTTDEVQTLTVKGAARGVGYFTIGYRFTETQPIIFGASADQVRDALVALSVIGTDAAHNPNVDVSKLTLGNGNEVYTITFQNGLGQMDIPAMTASVTPLLITGDTSTINIKSVTTTQGNFDEAHNEVQKVTVRGVTGLTHFTLQFEDKTTAPIDFGASADAVRDALAALPNIGGGNVGVVKSADDGADVYTITFKAALSVKDVASLIGRIAEDGVDTIKIQSITEDTFVLGGGSDDIVKLNVNALTGAPIAGNGVNARATLDGQGGGDNYDIHLVGGATDSHISVFDSGTADDGADKLVVTGTELPDLFLLRASASQQGLAFITLLNKDEIAAPAAQPYERVNYNVNLESIIVNSIGGDDQFYTDDTRATITVNMGNGNDFIQMGQLYQTERIEDPLTGIIDGDAYATIETTKGWLSNGISFPMTVNGEAGEDLFIVFHNLAVASLNGGADDDTFIIQAFALAGSTEDHRALTDLSGDAGADFIQYAVNAPVNINGGDGFDTVIVIGTEFGDDFVVTPRGVFGAGLNVNFINVELLQVDGAEGDDRFFVLGTGPELVTEISGGLGTDLFSVNGPTPANGVISNDLRGHSGILTTDVSSPGNELYDGLKAVGISANVADNDEPAIIVTPGDTNPMVVQGELPALGIDYASLLATHVLLSYSIVLSRPPVNSTEVSISIEPPPGLVFVKDDGSKLYQYRKGINANGDNPGGEASGLTLGFTGGNWYTPQTLYVMVDTQIAEIPDLGDLQHKVVVIDASKVTVPDIAGYATGGMTNGEAVIVTTLTPGDETHDEVQRVEVQHTGGFGYFMLTFRDAESDPIPFGASADDVATALLALPLIGKDANGQPNVAVSKTTSGGHDFYTVTFQNGLAAQDVRQIKAREAATLNDPTLAGLGLQPGGSQDLPEGLRGAFIAIVDSITHPEIVGQTRLILFNDATGTIVVNKPWGLRGEQSLSLPYDAKYEIKMYAGLSIPNVRVRIHTEQMPSLVVYQTEGSTSVAEATELGSTPLTDQLATLKADRFDVRLSKAPVGGDVTVALGGSGQLEFFDTDNLAGGPITELVFNVSNWNTFRHILVRGIDDGMMEGFHKADLTLSAMGGGYDNTTSLIVADIADNDTPGVRIVESNGSTDVIEATGDVALFGNQPPGTVTDDTYFVVLTQSPAAPVTVTVTAQPTRTSRTGGIRSFVPQLEVSADGGLNWGLTADITFDNTILNAWDAPHQVLVRAIDDTRVDGADAQVFAPTLDLLNSIQGPLFITGGSGPDRTGLTERAPVMLPYEKNEKTPMGEVVAATEAVGDLPATITIDPTDIDSTEIAAINDQPNASVVLPPTLTSPENLTDVTIQITSGPGANKVRIITGGVDNGDGTWTLTLGHEWFSPFPAPGNAEVPDGSSKYVLMQTNPNLLVHEPDQTDIVWVHDDDNVNSYNDPALPDGAVNNYAVGQLFYDDSLFGTAATVGVVTNGGPKVDGPAVNEVQRLVVNAINGTYTLIYHGNSGDETTTPLAWNASVGDIQSALRALPGIGDADVEVTQPDALESKFLIEFKGALGQIDVPKLHADAALLVGGTPLNEFRITGLGMGGTGDKFERIIGTGTDARSEPGGLTIREVENLDIYLGKGNNHFTIVDTAQGTKTTLNTGAGEDLVDVKTIAGHTFVNLGADNDTINVHNDANNLQGLLGLLTVSGDNPRVDVVTLAKGSPTQGSLIAPVDEIQRITVDATGGTFTLALTDPATHVTATTGDLPWDISAAALETALGDLSTVGAGNVEVTKAGNVYRVTFVNGKGAQDIWLMAANDANLTNGLGESDTMNVVDSGTTSATVGVLTSTSLTGLGTRQLNEIQTLVVDATQGTFTVAYDGHVSGALAYNASAEALKAALEALEGIKTGDVAVTRNDDVYVIRFQGNLTNADVPQLAAASIDLMKRVEPSGGDPDAWDPLAGDPTLIAGTVATSTRVEGTADPLLNDAQVVTVTATAGTYTLTLLGGTAQEFTTAPIPFDASTEVLRQTIQDAAAAAIAPGDTFEPQKFAVTVDEYQYFTPGDQQQSVYVIGFQGRLRQFDEGTGVDLLKVDAAALTGTATITTRMDGINYYGIETLNIELGTQTDIFNVQGTSFGSRGYYLGGGVAATNVRMFNGDEQVFVASNADLDHASVVDFDFLTGNLDDVRGALNLDFGIGRHTLMVSDEGATAGDNAVRITDIRPDAADAARLATAAQGAEIWITGLARGGISYGADATAGDFFGGIRYWSGSGHDKITIDGTINRTGSGERTMTLLNTGLGNDVVTVDLDGALAQPTGDTGEDGFFALNTMGGSFSPIPAATLPVGDSDNDIVRAAVSSLPLVIFGGLGTDDIQGGSNNDLIYGDDGRVQYLGGSDALTAVVGFGGRGDVISSQVLHPTWMLSRDLTLGGTDIVQGLGGEDILIGGAAGDFIDGNTDDDLIFGDAAKLSRRPDDITNGRFEALLDTQIYVQTGDEASGTDLVDGIARNYRDPDGSYAPSWARWQIQNLYHSFAIEAGEAGSLGEAMLIGGGSVTHSFGGDYIAGGAQSDQIFGQLGSDTIQGDGSIASAISLTQVLVGATRIGVVDFQMTPSYVVATSVGTLSIAPSFDATSDGDDYIEGNGGNDVVFGNLGQDDIVGGSSDLFTLDTPTMRPDGSDFLFGGSGTRIAHDQPAVTDGDVTIPDKNQRHARDADVIAGDNADIFRLVGLASPAPGEATTGFVHFAYDRTNTALGAAAYREDRGDLRIIARAVRLLDYTPGGKDYDAVSAASDIGGADEIHGESGDDFAYGMKGADRMFGDGEDDDLVGGWGADWISGGTGNDGILGDDGRIFTSRNGLAESLYAMPAVPAGQTLDQFISTPGKLQQATINVAGALKKTVDLTPFHLTPIDDPDDPLFAPQYANDILYGGLGDDAMHGGAGDDAISGAEALPAFFANPTNPGDVLRFGDWTSIDQRAGQFRDYDEYLPRLLMTPFLLNFDQADGPEVSASKLVPKAHTDGNDVLFGDLGNDWIVGGTGKDHLYGGWGNDLLNADDDLTTHGGLNDQPETDASYEDIAYGGSGRDVLIGNTGGDRLIDWVGEFNSYIVPFAPFGEATVSRTLQPQLPEYLYRLSASDGADFTRSGDSGGAAARNGEPDGELGVVLQKDFAWQDQTGAPIDPQAGNIPGGKRDVLRGADFNNGQAQGFAIDSGTWTVTKGRYQVAPTVAGGDAVAVFDVENYIPNYFEVLATINAVKPTGGTNANAYLVFDYQSQYDFKFAGLNVSTNKLEIGHRTEQGWVVDVQTYVTGGLKHSTDYNLFLSVNGSAVTLIVNNQLTLSYAFAPRADAYGFSHAIQDGMVGLGARNAKAQIDNVAVQRVPPAVTFSQTVDFASGLYGLFDGAASGTWITSNGRFAGSAMGGAPAIDYSTLRVTAAYALVDLSAVLSTTGDGGFVFDSYAANDFKFVTLSAGRITLGHVTPKGTFVDMSAANASVVTGKDYTLGATLHGSTVNVTLNGQTVMAYAYNAVVTDGKLGLLSRTGTTSFDSVTIKSDDPALSAHLMAAMPALTVGPAASIEAWQLGPIVDEAIHRWSLVEGQAAADALRFTPVRIADLPGAELGGYANGVVYIDVDAAGYGWFVDSTPADDSEYGAGAAAASGVVDLLSVVVHELGHAIGLGHTAGGVMQAALEAGVRTAMPGDDPAAAADPWQPSMAPADPAGVAARLHAATIDWGSGRYAIPPGKPAVPAAATWVDSFVSRLGQADGARGPNADLRLHLNVASKVSPEVSAL